MNRRSLLETVAATGLGALAGCGTRSGETSTSGVGPTAEASVTSAPSTTDTSTGEPAGTPSSAGRTIYVGPDGAADNDGTHDAPYDLLRHGIENAMPGDTVYVKPGRYYQSPRTRRPGTPEAPITITGPPEAVLSGSREDRYADGLTIRHSHVHLRGLTIDGLRNPDEPDDPLSYVLRGVNTLPAEPAYLQDLVIKPHAIGNIRTSMVKLTFVENVEVGEFRVTGPAGVRYMLEDRRDHVGEIVYVGSAPPANPNAVEKRGELLGLDTTNDVHIHHIDNSEGHHHSELVNPKIGTHDVVVEYCTDGGGSTNADHYPPASVALQGHGTTLRWCDLRDGSGYGVNVGAPDARDAQEENPESELTEAEHLGGTDNAIYGNRVTGFPEGAIVFTLADAGQTPEAQRVFCGNEVDGATDGDPEKPCPDEVPAGDGIGHLGGDSPWN